MKDTPGLSACIYTQLTDVETECNGVMTYDRAVNKVIPERGAAVNSGKLPPVSRFKEVVPTSQRKGIKWRYTFDKPAADWFKPSFIDSAWKEGPGGFGTEGTPGAAVRTEWKTDDIWLRRDFDWQADKAAKPVLLVHHDEDVEIYINGVLAGKAGGFISDYEETSMTPEGAAALKPGRNSFAVHCHQTTGGQYVDVGIVDVSVDSQKVSMPPLKPLFDYPLRDTCVCLGADGTYYLTGTTGYPTWWNTNEGIRVWKSTDLKNWEPLGLVWSFEKNSTWQKTKDGKRAIRAPEIHYFKKNSWIAYCVNTGGTGVLKSTSGKAEGPYADIKPDGPLTGEIDASLFDDDDGKIYFVYQNGKIARIKDDMTGLAEEPRLLKPANAGQVGFEGAFLTKIDGRYTLICAEFINGQYHCMAASAEKIYGPYGPRYLAVPHGGHNTLFRDKHGRWWSTLFGNDSESPFRERPAILPITFDRQGRIRPGE